MPKDFGEMIGQGRSRRRGGSGRRRGGGIGGALSPDELEEYLNRPSEPQSGGGSMMYGRSYNSTEKPTGASGEIDPRSGEGHASQYYADGTRVSWDTDGEGESGTHWTNQNVPKGKRNRAARHMPPPHAK